MIPNPLPIDCMCVLLSTDRSHLCDVMVLSKLNYDRRTVINDRECAK